MKLKSCHTTAVGEKTVGEENCISVGYGHLGDNNLHLNLVTPTYSTQLPRRAKSIVRFEYTVGPRLTGMLGGSLSSRFPTSGEIYPPGKLGCPPPGISGSEI
eukprot:sb/3478413/